MTLRVKLTAALLATALVAVLSATTDEWRDGTVDPAAFTQDGP